MGISEKKMQIVIDNYFKQECDVNTSIREAFEKGFRIGVKKASSAQPEWITCSMTKANLDNRICDIEENATNTETYREFMIYAIHEIYGDDARIPNFDNMSDEELNDLLDDLDYILGK